MANHLRQSLLRMKMVSKLVSTNVTTRMNIHTLLAAPSSVMALPIKSNFSLSSNMATNKQILSLLALCAKQGKWKLAYNMYFKLCNRISVNNSVLNYCLEIQLDNNQFQKAESIFTHMRQQKSIDTITYSNILSSYFYHRDYENVYRLYKLLQQDRINIQTAAISNVIIMALIHTRRLKEATNLFHNLRIKKVIDQRTYLLLFNLYIDQERYDEVLKLYQLMIQDGYSINNTSLGNLLLIALTTTMQIQEAIQIFTTMRHHHYVNEWSYLSMIKLYMKLKNFHESINIYQLMVSDGYNITNAIIGNFILLCYLENHQLSEAYNIYQYMTQQNLVDEQTVYILHSYGSSNNNQ